MFVSPAEELIRYSLREVNLYPYLTWIFYGVLFLSGQSWMKTKKRLYTVFLITLIFETAFIIDVGFFIRPSYILGLILVLKVFMGGVTLPRKYVFFLILFVISGVIGILINSDLIGKAFSNESRATFLRPIIELSQLLFMIFTAASVFTLLKREHYFSHTVRIIHWLAVIVAFSAIYELIAIYFHLPYLNLNNMLPHYWYPRFGFDNDFSPGFLMFRARVTFIEPIELNNFQFFGLACSLMYRLLYQKSWKYYFLLLTLQVVVLLGTFSRSTLFTFFAMAPLFFLFYPQKAYTALEFFLKRFFTICVVGILVFFIQYIITMTPEKLAHSHVLVKALLTRNVLNQSEADKPSILGRGEAVDEVQKFFNGERFFFGVGIGNDANWMGGIGGSNSLYTQIFMFTGIIGTSIFLLFLGCILFSLLKNYLRPQSDLTHRRIFLVAVVGFLSMLIQRFAFSGLLNDTYLWVAFAFFIYLGEVKKIDDLNVQKNTTISVQKEKL